MSYIYALYFVEQNAVKIGKANDLFTRLSDLVSTWGNIDPYRAKAWELDELLVLGGENPKILQLKTLKQPTDTSLRIIDNIINIVVDAVRLASDNH